jgi:hypothetical protein
MQDDYDTSNYTRHCVNDSDINENELVIVGNDNTINSGHNVVIGNDNTINSICTVIGNDNKINADGCYVNGNDNICRPGRISYAFGNHNTGFTIKRSKKPVAQKPAKQIIQIQQQKPANVVIVEEVKQVEFAKKVEKQKRQIHKLEFVEVAFDEFTQPFSDPDWVEIHEKIKKDTETSQLRKNIIDDYKKDFEKQRKLAQEQYKKVIVYIYHEKIEKVKKEKEEAIKKLKEEIEKHHIEEEKRKKEEEILKMKQKFSSYGFTIPTDFNNNADSAGDNF